MSKLNAPWKDEALAMVQALKSGGIILSATDTVWGLACDATNAEAVARMAELKGRPLEKSFLALVSDDGQMERLLPNLPDAAWELIEASDRPVTVVGQAGTGHRLADGMVRGDGSLGVRCVQEPFLQFIIRGLARPLASTSANLSGAPTPARLQDVAESVKAGVDVVGTWQPERSAPPSWVVRFDETGRFSVLRP